MSEKKNRLLEINLKPNRMTDDLTRFPRARKIELACYGAIYIVIILIDSLYPCAIQLCVCVCVRESFKINTRKQTVRVKRTQCVVLRLNDGNNDACLRARAIVQKKQE